MAKAISFSLEKSDVYDISVPGSECFVLDSGVCAHNCAHSQAYGIVGYNSGWLKYYYPAHYWAGMLNITEGDQDDIKACLDECGHLVLGINASKSHGSDWTIEEFNGKEYLRPPLNIIKGCGGVSTDPWVDVAKKSNDIKDLLANTVDTKQSYKLSIPTFVRLLFAGAFDYIFGGKRPEFQEYMDLFNEIKKVTGSKASLTKKTRTEFIGLNELDSDLSLEIWRHQANPFHKTSFLKFVENKLLSSGFTKDDRNYSVFKYLKNDKESRIYQYVTENWSMFFNLYKDKPAYFEEFKSGLRDIILIGIITDVRVASYASKNGERERLCVTLYIGKETVSNLVMWPRTNKIDSAAKYYLSQGQPVMLTVTPGLYKGEPNGSISGWKLLKDMIS